LLIDEVGLSRRRRGTESTLAECGILKNAQLGTLNQTTRQSQCLYTLGTSVLPFLGEKFLKSLSEFVECSAGDGCAEKVREFFGIGDRFDLLAKALGDSMESNFQRFEDVLLSGEDQAFLSTFLTTLLTAFAETFLAELFGE
jgi:hypothetical protein